MTAVTEFFGALAVGGFLPEDPEHEQCRYAVEAADDVDQEIGFREAYFTSLDQARAVAQALVGSVARDPTATPRFVWLCEYGSWQTKTGQTQKGWLHLQQWERDTQGGQDVRKYGLPIEGRATPVGFAPSSPTEPAIVPPTPPPSP